MIYPFLDSAFRQSKHFALKKEGNITNADSFMTKKIVKNVFSSHAAEVEVVQSKHCVYNNCMRRYVSCKFPADMLQALFNNTSDSTLSHIQIIKLACESQLTEILFKLLIKLAWESQLTDILFKLILIIILTRLNLQLLLLLEL